MIDTVAFIEAARILYPQLVHLQDYFLVDRGEGEIEVQGWPENFPQPDYDQIQEARAAIDLAGSKVELASRNTLAAAQIARIQDRVDTLGYGVDIGEATAEDEAELSALAPILKAWKTYKYALGKVATQPTWPTAPVWPPAPAIPEIAADPAALAPDTI